MSEITPILIEIKKNINKSIDNLIEYFEGFIEYNVSKARDCALTEKDFESWRKCIIK